ncbi:MAG: ECF transporter S component [Armatimonadetes bacterium]|nr:ECF transporter S component [Armatimonadota bacterium]
MSNKSTRAEKIIKTGALSAIAAFLMFFFQFPLLPQAPFLKYDPSDIPALIGGFALGPMAGLAIIIIKNLIFLMLKFTPEDIIGIPMNTLAAGTFVFSSAYIYRHNKTKKNALLALSAGIILMTLIMIPANLFLYPLFIRLFFLKISLPALSQIFSFIIFSTVPFNLLKGILNAAAVFFIYKRISGYLKEKNF